METRHINSRFSALIGAVALTLTYASVASAQIVRRTSYDVGLTVYADDNFSGRSATLRTDIPNFDALGLNDRISSFRVARNQRWEICDAAYYRGRCTTISGSESSLRSSGWENRISSARLVSSDDSRSRRPARLVLYTQPGFRGQSFTVVDGQSSLPRNLNRVRSVQVMGGTWQICPSTGYRGRCVAVSSSVSNLNAIGLRGNIGSIRLIERR
jgi:hypothetical protein